MNSLLLDNHEIIERSKNYILDRKLLTVHSEDRNSDKWPNSNHFEIQLPQAYTNVESMRLVEISLPSNYYTFSNYNQNTKLSFKLIPSKDYSENIYKILSKDSSHNYIITIQEGFYSPEELASEINNKMNNSITKLVNSYGIQMTYVGFKIYYDKVGLKFYFVNNKDNFILTFNNKIDYDLPSCDKNNVWCQSINWGLPYNLGFNKQEYISTNISQIRFDYIKNNNVLITETPNFPLSFVEAPLTINIYGETAIYMEVDKYNSYDELYPYSENDTSGGGRVKSAFAKILITSKPNSIIFDSRNNFLQNTVQFVPPCERIQKFKFKFRYHDGRLVDFKNIPLNFTIEINQLKNEISNNLNVRIPSLLNV